MRRLILMGVSAALITGILVIGGPAYGARVCETDPDTGETFCYSTGRSGSGGKVVDPEGNVVGGSGGGFGKQGGGGGGVFVRGTTCKEGYGDCEPSLEVVGHGGGGFGSHTTFDDGQVTRSGGGGGGGKNNPEGTGGTGGRCTVDLETREVVSTTPNADCPIPPPEEPK